MLEVILAVIALVIPTAALGLDFSNRRRDAAQRKSEIELENSRYMHEQRLQATERLASWARRVTERLSLADHMLNCKLEVGTETSSGTDRLKLAAEISALVDEGRWLFRNHRPDEIGFQKARINRGFRDNRLDALIDTYQALLGDNVVEPSTSRKDFTWKIQQLSIPLSDQILKESD